MSEASLLTLWGSFSILFGLIIGSFLNVCILRMPLSQSIIKPRSHCPICGKNLRLQDNIPVLSWILLKGRCRTCDQAIPLTYPLIELLTALVAWLCFRRFIPSADAINAANLAAWAVYFGFLANLIVVTFIDLRHKIIPDESSIFAIPVGIGAILLLSTLGFDDWLALSWKEAVIGAVAGGGFFALIAITGLFVLGREALGMGDVKLLAMIGAFIGALPGVWMVVLLGSLFGSFLGLAMLVVKRQRTTLAFGPPLALAAATYVLYGDVLIRLFLPGMATWMNLSVQ